MASITSNKGTCEPVARNSVTANKITHGWLDRGREQKPRSGGNYFSVPFFVSGFMGSVVKCVCTGGTKEEVLGGCEKNLRR
jgi:hypothetical protein